MRIKQMLSRHRNDFTATMECEYCGETWHNSSGYNDAYYHSEVIPAMKCSKCGKSRNDLLADTAAPGETEVGT